MISSSSSTILCNLPILLLVIIAALDSADKALLAASFPMLEKTLGLHVDTLGYFSLFTNLSYALSLPLWGWIIHRYTVHRSHVILCTSCFLWGVATLSISISDSVVSQALFRSLNGAALASIMPLSQMMLTELVIPAFHGRAFGLMGFLEKIAATMSTSAVIWWEDWRTPYRFVGCMSICMAIVSKGHLKMGRGRIDHKKNEEEDDEEQLKRPKQKEEEMTFLQIFHRISKIPVFMYLVAQGLFGASESISKQRRCVHFNCYFSQPSQHCTCSHLVLNKSSMGHDVIHTTITRMERFYTTTNHFLSNICRSVWNPGSISWRCIG